MKALGAAERGSLRKLGLSFLEPAGLGENEARIGLHDAQSQRPDSRLTLKGVQGSSAVAFGNLSAASTSLWSPARAWALNT